MRARVAGLLRNKYDDFTPAGFHIAVHVGEGEAVDAPVAQGFSHIDGGFVIWLDDAAQRALQEAGALRLTVADRFGRRVIERWLPRTRPRAGF